MRASTRSKSSRFWSRLSRWTMRPLRVGQPVDAGEIDVGIGAEVGLDPAAAVGVHQVKVDHRIGGAGARIALLEGGGLVGADRGAGGDLDPAVVDPRDRDAAVVGRPPMALGAAHFLLRDEFGEAPADRFRRAAR